MALRHRTRKRLSLLVLVVGLPAYVVLAVTVLNLIGRPPIWVEFLVYVLLGVLWALPLRWLFLGVGKDDPDGTPRDGR